jgi:hypothetical protein
MLPLDNLSITRIYVIIIILLTNFGFNCNPLVRRLPEEEQPLFKFN